jgi:endonuclease G, mitochondrial
MPTEAIVAGDLTPREAVLLLRRQAQRWLRLPNVTSVGVGREIRRGRLTGNLSIQATVREKLSKREINRRGLPPLPDVVTGSDGRRLPVDVLQRHYKPSYVLVPPPAAAMAGELPSAALPPEILRRRRLDLMKPGISISNIRGVAGTIGAIVFDTRTGAPCVLSNAHVLQTFDVATDDAVVQPGVNDDGNVAANVIGRVLRSHLGLAGDCAVAAITGRAFDMSILELDVRPQRLAAAELDDLVIKSGRTTGVTAGEVTRVGVVVSHNYGGAIGLRDIGAFEYGPRADAPPGAVMSLEGDSGALLMIEENGVPTDIAVGLNFAVDAGELSNSGHALACPLHSVFEKLAISFTLQA